MTELSDLGWDAAFAEAFAPYEQNGLVPMRVVSQHRGAWDLLGEQGELRVGHAVSAAAHAVVGDWVATDGESIHAVLPRRSSFSRTSASNQHRRSDEQVVASNVDVVFLVQALGRDLNLRRLERYLAAAWESGAQPAVLLTKADLHADEVAESVAAVRSVAAGAPVHAISSRTGEGLDDVRAYLQPGRTVALLGSSGVGKSTLVNAIAGEELLAVGEVRESDGRGRHTTTARYLVPLPGGGLLLDTPGMRELQLWAGDIDEAFADVVALAANCRFSDCRHDREPGCAVREGIPAERLESYRELERELEDAAQRQLRAAQSGQRRRRDYG